MGPLIAELDDLRTGTVLLRRRGALGLGSTGRAEQHCQARGDDQ
jgi:hypothetical protein